MLWCSHGGTLGSVRFCPQTKNKRFLEHTNQPTHLQADKPPTVILLAGLQGAGKTTAAAKLALYCQSRAEKAGAFEKV